MHKDRDDGRVSEEIDPAVLHLQEPLRPSLTQAKFHRVACLSPQWEGAPSAGPWGSLHCSRGSLHPPPEGPKLLPDVFSQVQGAMRVPPGRGGQGGAMGPQSPPGRPSGKGLRGRLSAVVGGGLLAFQEGGHGRALDVDDTGVHHLTVNLHHHLVAQGGIVQALWWRHRKKPPTN